MKRKNMNQKLSDFHDDLLRRADMCKAALDTQRKNNHNDEYYKVQYATWLRAAIQFKRSFDFDEPKKEHYTKNKRK